jgi:hypothetical protein
LPIPAEFFRIKNAVILFSPDMIQQFATFKGFDNILVIIKYPFCKPFRVGKFRKIDLEL